MPKQLLFVCSGNTCRSPIAEGIFKQMLQTSSFANNEIEIHSAGLFAINDEPASKLAIDVMKEAGIDISSHKSLRLTKGMLEKSDLILTMSNTHLESIYKQWPIDSQKKVFLLKAFAENISTTEAAPNYNYSKIELNIKDPFGGTKSDYELCLKTIKEELQKRFQPIIEFLKQ